MRRHPGKDSSHRARWWAGLFSNFATFARLSSNVDALRIAGAVPLAFLYLVVAGSPASFPAESRRFEVDEARRFVSSCATVVTTASLSPYFADRSSLLILKYRSLWTRAPHDRSTETFLLYESAEPPSGLLSHLSPYLTPVPLGDRDRDEPELILARISTDSFWAALPPAVRHPA